MIVRFKAGSEVINEFLSEKVYHSPYLLSTDYPTPKIDEAPIDLLDAVDKFNYGLMSKTELTEFLYRVFGNSAKQTYNSVADAIEFIF
jgi:hypothetical protein